MERWKIKLNKKAINAVMKKRIKNTTMERCNQESKERSLINGTMVKMEHSNKTAWKMELKERKVKFPPIHHTMLYAC